MTEPTAPTTPAPASEKPGRWRDLARRTASAAVLAPVAIACLWYGGAAWIALVALAVIGLAWEWMHMLRPPLRLAVRVALGALVIVPPAAALIGLRLGSAGFVNILYLLLIVWASDIGAYLVGRLVGGPRLAPRISPGKTWSGGVGGLLAAGLVGYAAAALLAPPTNLHAFGLASFLGLVSQLGDLAESALKRHCGVKDSGALIPGHGGVFDRLDGLLAAATAMGVLATTTGYGLVLWH